MKKRFLSTLLALCMLLTLLPAQALAAGEGGEEEPAVQTSTPTPTVDEREKEIFANGVPLLLLEGGGGSTKTLIYLDKGILGVKDNADVLWEPFSTAAGDVGNDLKDYTIYGGSATNLKSNTSITMLGGRINAILGGGKGGNLTGDVTLNVVAAPKPDSTNPPQVQKVYGGGLGAAVTGDVTINLEQPPAWEEEQPNPEHISGGSAVSGAGVSTGTEPNIVPAPITGDVTINMNGGVVSSLSGPQYTKIDGKLDIHVNDGIVMAMYGTMAGEVTSDLSITVSNGLVGILLGNVMGKIKGELSLLLEGGASSVVVGGADLTGLIPGGEDTGEEKPDDVKVVPKVTVGGDAKIGGKFPVGEGMKDVTGGLYIGTSNMPVGVERFTVQEGFTGTVSATFIALPDMGAGFNEPYLLATGVTEENCENITAGVSEVKGDYLALSREGDQLFVTQTAPAVVTIKGNSLPYETLEKALEAATAEDVTAATVTLAKDVTLTDTLTVAPTGALTLDLGAFTITGKSGREDDVEGKDALNITAGSVTITGGEGSGIIGGACVAGTSGWQYGGHGVEIGEGATVTVTGSVAITGGNGNTDPNQETPQGGGGAGVMGNVSASGNVRITGGDGNKTGGYGVWGALIASDYVTVTGGNASNNASKDRDMACGGYGVVDNLTLSGSAMVIGGTGNNGAREAAITGDDNTITITAGGDNVTLYGGNTADTAVTVIPSGTANETIPHPYIKAVTTSAITKDVTTGGSFTVTVNGAAVEEATAGSTVAVVPTAADDYVVGAVSVVKTGDATTTVAVNNNTFTMPFYPVTVNVTFKAVPAAPNVSFAFDGDNPGKLMGATTAMEYSLDGGTTWADCAADMPLTVASITADKDILVRLKETGTAGASDSLTIDIEAGDSIPDNTVAAVPCTIDNTDGKLTGLTAAMEYQHSSATNWTPAPAGEATGLVPGTYRVRNQATGTKLAGPAKEITIDAFHVVYIKNSGNDDKDGLTEANAVKTWGKAVALANGVSDYTIVVCDNMTIPADTVLPAGTIIGKNENIVLTTGANVSLSGELTFDKITLSGDERSSIWASGRSLTMGAGVLVPQGKYAFAAVWGGKQSGVADYAVIALNSGVYGNVYGGSHGNGNNTGGSSVVIRGTARVTGNVYGGGVNSAVVNNTWVVIGDDATVGENNYNCVYGGGFNANVTNSADVTIKDRAKVLGSVIAGSQGDGATVGKGALYLADTATIGGDLSAFSDKDKQENAEIWFDGFTSETYADDRNIMVSANKLKVQNESSFYVSKLTTNVKDVWVEEGSTLHLRWDSEIYGELSGMGTLVMDKTKLTVGSVKTDTALKLAIDPGVMGILERDVIVKGGDTELDEGNFTLQLPDGYDPGSLTLGANGNIQMTAQSPYFTLPAGFKPFVWNTADVVVTAKAGYQLSTSEGGTYAPTLTLSDVGVNAPTIYIKPTTGDVISQPLYYKLDKTPPTLTLSPALDADQWYGAQSSIEVTAHDGESGIIVNVARDGEPVDITDNEFAATTAGVYTVTVANAVGMTVTATVKVDPIIDDFASFVVALDGESTLDEVLAVLAAYNGYTEAQRTHIQGSDAGKADRAKLLTILSGKFGDVVKEIADIIAANGPIRTDITTAQTLYDLLDETHKNQVDKAALDILLQRKQDAVNFLLEIRNHTDGDWDELKTLVAHYKALPAAVEGLLFPEEREGYKELEAKHDAVKNFIDAVDAITRPYNSDTPLKVRTASEKLDAATTLSAQGYIPADKKATYDGAVAAVTAAVEVLQKIIALPDHKPGEDCANNGNDFATHKAAVENAKFAYEKLIQEWRAMVPAENVTKLNGQYNALIGYLGYISEKDDVEVIGLAEKVDTPAGTNIIIALSAEKKTPADDDAKTALEAAKGEAQSGNSAIGQVGCYDIKLLATVDGVTQEVQPKGGESILVRIKLPGNLNLSTLSIYHIKDNNSTHVKLAHQLVTENGETYAVFETDSFSYFALFAQQVSTGGGSSAPTWAPVIGAVKGGTVTVTPKYPTTGSKVTVTAKPDESHLPGWVVVTDKNGEKVEVTDNGNGTYTFIQPSGKVNITVIFKPGENALPFKDVPFEKFVMFYDAIKFVYENNIMQGTSQDSFSPMLNTDRATIVTILWRLEGKPAARAAAGFSDVTADAWYADSAAWAAESGVVKGYSDGRYAPADPITREQLAAIFYRYAQSKGVDVSGGTDADVQAIMDVELVSPYAMPALRWVCSAGLFANSPNTRMTPDKPITRVALAATLERFVNYTKIK